MLQRLSSSIPLLLIAGTNQAVQLEGANDAQAECCEPGCDQKNDVAVNIDFNVAATRPHDYHEHQHLPTALDIEVANMIAALDEQEKLVEIQTAVDGALREYKAAEKLRIENEPAPEPEVVIQEVIVEKTLVVTDVVTETVVERVILSDASALSDGTTWEDIRPDAMEPDYKTSSAFLDLSEADQELVCALIMYEEAKEVLLINVTDVATDTDVSSITNDFEIAGNPWSTARSTFMAPGFFESISYTDLSDEDKIKAIALIETQKVVDAEGNDYEGLSDREFAANVTTTTRTGPISDETPFIFNGSLTTWADLKSEAGFPDFTSSPNYLALNLATKALVDALIAAQAELGDNAAPLPYGDSITLVTRTATIEEIITCPAPSGDCGDNPYVGENRLVKPSFAGEDSTCNLSMTVAYIAYTQDYIAWASKWEQMCSGISSVQGIVEDMNKTMWKNQDFFTFMTTEDNTTRDPILPLMEESEEPAALKALYFGQCDIVAWSQYEEILNATYDYRRSLGGAPASSYTPGKIDGDISTCSGPTQEFAAELIAAFDDGRIFADRWSENNMLRFNDMIVNYFFSN